MTYTCQNIIGRVLNVPSIKMIGQPHNISIKARVERIINLPPSLLLIESYIRKSSPSFVVEYVFGTSKSNDVGLGGRNFARIL